MAEETEVGKVMDFFAKPVVAGIEMTGTMKTGDKLHIKGHTTDLEMVSSRIRMASPWMQVGMYT